MIERCARRGYAQSARDFRREAQRDGNPGGARLIIGRMAVLTTQLRVVQWIRRHPGVGSGLVDGVIVAAMTGAAVYLQRVDGVPFPVFHYRIFPSMTGTARWLRLIILGIGRWRRDQHDQSKC